LKKERVGPNYPVTCNHSRTLFSVSKQKLKKLSLWAHLHKTHIDQSTAFSPCLDTSKFFFGHVRCHSGDNTGHHHHNHCTDSSHFMFLLSYLVINLDWGKSRECRVRKFFFSLEKIRQPANQAPKVISVFSVCSFFQKKRHVSGLMDGFIFSIVRPRQKVIRVVKKKKDF
jgi:hypothetical protein